ncbi:MAG: hypothetical protein HYU37_05030 [Acidobacteria bacterium]|nr:hypothetical protein [Acidobacteriota bacterium]
MSGSTSATRQSTPDLDVATFLTDQTVAPGHRFSIVLDVTPKPGMRVVAPGQHAYRIVALRLEPSENLRVYRFTLPPSTEVTVSARNERVPAYTQPFRLVQDVAVVVMRICGSSPRSPARRSR